jgi:hypothetical protein
MQPFAVSNSQFRKDRASNSRRVRVPTEGFLATAGCVDVSSTTSWNSSRSRADVFPAVSTFEFEFPCGRRRVFYPQKSLYPMTVDSYACQSSNSSLVYFFGVDSTSASLEYLYQCDVSLSSTIVWTDYSLGGDRGNNVTDDLHQVYPDTATSKDLLPIPSSAVVQTLGRNYFNVFGCRGFEAASMALSQLSNSTMDRAQHRERFERLLSVMSRYYLASMSSYIWWNTEKSLTGRVRWGPDEAGAPVSVSEEGKVRFFFPLLSFFHF